MNEQHRRTQRRPAVAPVEEPARSPFSGVAGRFAAWITGADRIPDYDDFDEFETEYGVYDDDVDDRGRPMRHSGRPSERARAAQRGRGAAARAREARQSRRTRPVDPDELEAQEMPAIDEPGDELPQQYPEPSAIVMGEPSRFPLVGLGYDRAAVDEHLAAIERELDRLRAQTEPPVSVAEELERLGEQTASILVVAHDQAQETARLAREEAERRVADAHAEAAAITAKASARLRELDDDTDAVWRERERLLEDARMVSVALGKLADDASARFPAAPAQDTAPFDALAGEPDAFAQLDRLGDEGSSPGQPSATVSGTSDEEAAAPGDESGAVAGGESCGAAGEEPSGAAGLSPGDTGSWLVGLRPEAK